MSTKSTLRQGRRRRITSQATASGAAIMAGGMVFSGSADAQVLFSEDFDDLALGPYVVETPLDAEGTDWTDTPPAGWTRDNTTTPAEGVPEFFGWTFHDRDSWFSTAGDQGRASFTRGSGIVAVADGDEYDDVDGGIIEGDPGLMNVFLQTPAISTSGFGANSLVLNFDSSFRPYPTQQGLVDVSFDGGTTFSNLLTLNDSTAGGTSSLSRANENVVLPIANPGDGGDVVVRFGYVDAGNDWWWAIDNVRVLAGDPLPTAIVDRDTGEVRLINGTTGPVDISAYSIESAGGALIESNWTPIAGRLDSVGDGSIDSDGEWTALTLAGQSDNLSEASLDASDNAAGGSLPLGADIDLSSEGSGAADGAWRRTPIEDVTFRYVSGGEIIEGLVSYVGTPLAEGDFDADGDIDAADWAITRDNQRGDFSTLSTAEAYQLGDLNGDGVNGHADFVAFKELFDAANGAGSFAAMLAIPEPMTVSLIVVGGLLAAVPRRS